MATKLRRTASTWIRPLRCLWKFLSWIWVAIVISGLVNIASSWVTTKAPLGWILGHLEIILPLIGAFLVLTGLARLASFQDEKQTGARTIPLSPSQKHHERVLQRLRRSYDTLLEDSLQRAAWLELGLLEKPDAVQNAATLLVRAISLPERQLPPGTSIVQVYQDAGQDLLILGEPGSGKTTHLYALAQYLVNQAETNKADPLPVVLPLSGWARHRLPLQLWIGEQLTQIYQIPESIALQWLQNGHVLPLLDGLDEMEETARPACIQAINAYHRDHLHSLVVCSRTAEYTAASTTKSLSLQTAVVIQPLRAAQVEAVLIQGGGALTGLRRAYQTNPLLQELAANPLMLNLLILTYQGVEVEDLPTKESALQQQLFTHYVKRMVQRKGNVTRYCLQETIFYLRLIAMFANSFSSFNAVGLVGVFHLTRSIVVPGRLDLRDTPYFEEMEEGIKKIERQFLWSALGISELLWGSISGLIVGSYVGPIPGLFAGLFIGLMSTRVFISDPSHIWFIPSGSAQPKRWTLISLFFIIVFVLFFSTIPFSQFFSIYRGVLVGLFVAVSLSSLDRRVFSNIWFYLWRFWYWRSHFLPWDVADFLEDARARHFLLRDGQEYRFIHGLLLEYFANLKDEA